VCSAMSHLPKISVDALTAVLFFCLLLAAAPRPRRVSPIVLSPTRRDSLSIFHLRFSSLRRTNRICFESSPLSSHSVTLMLLGGGFQQNFFSLIYNRIKQTRYGLRFSQPHLPSFRSSTRSHRAFPRISPILILPEILLRFDARIGFLIFSS